VGDTYSETAVLIFIITRLQTLVGDTCSETVVLIFIITRIVTDSSGGYMLRNCCIDIYNN
jgi:hypothetical protein